MALVLINHEEPDIVPKSTVSIPGRGRKDPSLLNRHGHGGQKTVLRFFAPNRRFVRCLRLTSWDVVARLHSSRGNDMTLAHRKI